MGIIKKFSIFGWHFGGAEVQVDSKMTFRDIGNLLLNTSGGSVLWYLKTAVTNAFRIRDNAKSQDIISINTNDDTVVGNSNNYEFKGFSDRKIVNIVFADSPYTASWNEDINCDCTLGIISVLFPTSVAKHGQTLVITKNDVSANKVAYTPFGAETVNTALPLELTSQYDSSIFISVTDATIGKR